MILGLGIAGGRFPEGVAVACRWHSGLADLARYLFPVYVDKRYSSGGRTHLDCLGWMVMLANLSALFSGSWDLPWLGRARHCSEPFEDP